MQLTEIEGLNPRVKGIKLDGGVTQFLDLPLEIRQQVYDYVIPVCRLAPFPYLDAEWSMKTPEHRGVPQIMLTSRKLHDEIAPLVYSKAILEVAPAQQSHVFFHIQDHDSNKIIPFSYTRLSSTFRFYRAEHLKLIRKAHIFSNQADVIDGQCYEALLQWLIEHTSVENIQLSSRPMTRIRGKAIFDLPSWQATFHQSLLLQKGGIIRIWTRAKRTPWEYEKMMRLRCKATDDSFCQVQTYFWFGSDSLDAANALQLDPRWSTRANDDPEKIDILHQAVPQIDKMMYRTLTGKELSDYKNNSRHFDGDYWVYQMILVAGREW